MAKYERARSNVEAFTGKEAADLARACTLNLSSCYLNLKQYDKCIEQCNTVLAGRLRVTVAISVTGPVGRVWRARKPKGRKRTLGNLVTREQMTVAYGKGAG